MTAAERTKLLHVLPPPYMRLVWGVEAGMMPGVEGGWRQGENELATYEVGRRVSVGGEE